MAPENTPLEKEKSLQTTNVWVHNVSFRWCGKYNLKIIKWSVGVFVHQHFSCRRGMSSWRSLLWFRIPRFGSRIISNLASFWATRNGIPVSFNHFLVEVSPQAILRSLHAGLGGKKNYIKNCLQKMDGDFVGHLPKNAEQGLEWRNSQTPHVKGPLVWNWIKKKTNQHLPLDTNSGSIFQDLLFLGVPFFFLEHRRGTNQARRRRRSFFSSDPFRRWVAGGAQCACLWHASKLFRQDGQRGVFCLFELKRGCCKNHRSARVGGRGPGVVEPLNMLEGFVCCTDMNMI